MWYGGSTHKETFTEEQLTLCFEYLDHHKPTLEEINKQFPNGIFCGTKITPERFRGMCLHLLRNNK